MPRFRFVAVDSTGALHDGAINAPGEAEARNRLASNGLAVRTVEEVAAGPDDPPPAELPRPSPSRPAAGPPLQPRDAAVAPPVHGSRLPLVLSLLALVVAVGTAGFVALSGDRPYNRLGKYDFDTPEAAYRSWAAIQSSGDSRLVEEYNRRFLDDLTRERLDTLDVPRSADFHGMKVLFVEYKQGGWPRREVVVMERERNGGGWRRANVFLDHVRAADPELHGAILKWQSGR